MAVDLESFELDENPSEAWEALNDPPARAQLERVPPPKPVPPPAEPMQVEASEDAASLEDELVHRLEVVGYYQVLLGGSFFGDDQSAAALAVGKEIGDFVRSRVRTLLNLGADGSDAGGFTVNEIKVLKLIAQQALTNPKLLGRQAAREVPAVPTAPAVRGKPTLRQYVPPGGKAKPAAAPAAPQRKLVPKPAPVESTGAAPADGEVVEEGGRRFKVKYREIDDVSIFTPSVRKQLNDLELDQVATLPDGSRILRQGMETWTKVVLLDITPQAADPSSRRVPFPTDIQQMEAATAQSASASYAIVQKNLANLGRVRS